MKGWANAWPESNAVATWKLSRRNPL
jgi:hypothetical protein